jgi:hypothetical protein
MKILFVLLEDEGFQIRSLCSEEEVSGAVESIKEKLGENISIYALDNPDLIVTGVDLAGAGLEAKLNEASALVEAALERGRTEKNLTGLECLNPPDDTEEEPMRDEDIAPVTYVIFRPEKDDFLLFFDGSDEDEMLTQWASHPNQAIRYETLREAQEMAERIVADGYYELKVCACHETEKQLQIRGLTDHGGYPDAGISLN